MQGKIDSYFHGNDRGGSGNDIRGRIAIRPYVLLAAQYQFSQE